MATESKEDTSAKEEINSKAIVKNQTEIPKTFTHLTVNTNLNLPPSNWLHHLHQSYGMQELPKSLGFSSFKMGHLFPDCIVSSGQPLLIERPYHPHPFRETWTWCPARRISNVS